MIILIVLYSYISSAICQKAIFACNDFKNQGYYFTDKIKAKFQIVIILLFRKY